MRDRELLRLATLVFVQMIPATLLAPAIRPLVATLHGGDERLMHAFMSLGMLGAAIAAPLVGAAVDRTGRVRLLATALCVAHAALLPVLVAPLPGGWFLALRLLEGAAHVGAATVLLSEAAHRARTAGSGRVMGYAGGALMLAVGAGSLLGGGALLAGIRAPFVLGSVASLVAATLAMVWLPARRERGAHGPVASGSLAGRIAVPLAAAFVSRFTVGCLIVTFSLLAHRAHGVSDPAVGALYAAFTFSFAACVYPAGRLSDALSPQRLMVLGGLAYSAVLPALGFAPTPMLAPLMVLGGVASALLFGPALAWAASAAGSTHRGRAMAMLQSAGAVGMVAGPAAAGALMAGWRGEPLDGYRRVLAVAGVSVLAFLGAWALARALRRVHSLSHGRGVFRRPAGPERRAARYGPRAPASD